MYLRSWNSAWIMAGAAITSLAAIYLYLQVRKLFNRLDASGSLPIKRREILSFSSLYFFTMLFSAGKVSMGILWLHIGNLVVLSFLAFTDFKTKLLDVPVLCYLFIQNVIFYISFCLIRDAYQLTDWKAIGIYSAAVLLCCMVRALAIGDGCIYAAMLPAMLVLQGQGGYLIPFIFLLMPLVLFILIESGKAMLKKRLDTLLSERKPFAPYLLAGYIISFLIYVMMPSLF